MNKDQLNESKTIRNEPERYIVTSALPYVNGIKHLGNLIGSLLPADVYTRYLRRRGKDAIYICGTDEHGTPAEISALEEGLPVEEYCKKYYEIQKRIYEKFHLDFTYFGRTSAPENHEITQDLFLKQLENGYIFEKKDKQLFCLVDERYLPDRYVTGTCPHCGYERARGDQCEHCSTLLDPTDLINPQCVICKQEKIEIRDTNHFYLDLPKLEPEVRAWVQQQTQWPVVSRSIALKWLNEGLRPRAITRNLKWGIRIPLEGYDDVRFYVWYDAPNGYISITKQWANEIGKPDLWLKYWKDPSTRLIQFLGSDNVPFHTVMWPASLIAARDNYILAYMVKGFNWLTYEGGKFSTSENRGIFTDQALELFPADYWRYYLLLIAPERQNTDFRWEGFAEAVNKDLLGSLGNLVNRVVTFLNREFEGKVGKVNLKDPEIKELADFLAEKIKAYIEVMDSYEFQKTVVILKTLWHEGNKFFQSRAPWKAVKDDREHAWQTLSAAAHYLRSVAILSEPFIPETAEKIFHNLGLNSEDVHKSLIDNAYNFEILVGTTVAKDPEVLFQKIEKKQIKELIKRFGGAEKKDDKRSKKQKSTKNSKSETAITYEEFSKLDIRVGKIIDAERVGGSDKLLKLRITLGTETRIIVSGIGDQYEPESLIGKQVPVLTNLKPRKFKGILSEGMILMTGSDDVGWYFLIPEQQVPEGSKVL